MNHVPSHIISATARPLTRRALAKLRTRQALLAAAKQLFTERGYEQATVRDIARAAGMSTGAVFANFTDKSDLFGEILQADLEALAEGMRQVAAQERPVAEALKAVLSSGYAFHLKQLPLLQAAIGATWQMTAEEEARVRSNLRPVLETLEGVLARAQEKGEIRKDADIELLADLAWAAYRSNFRLAVFQGYELEALTDRLQRQLDIILSAARA